MEIERLTLQADSSGQEFFLRLFRFHGTGKGPTVYIQAALHAQEMPGMVALDRLIPRLEAAEDEARLAGNVTLVPHANPVGLSQALFGETLGRFDCQDRTNFNRCFPSDTVDMHMGRPAADRLKATLLGLAVEADVVLDLHCDDEGPVYLYVLERQLDEGRRLAKAMQAAVILTVSGADPFSFVLTVADRWAADRRAGDARFAATVELRGLLDVSPELAERDAQGLYRYLVDIGTVRDTLPAISPAKPVTGDIDAAVLITSPVPGAIHYDVEIGDRVAEGQRLAAVVSEAGMGHHEIRAPFEGLVMTRRDRRLVRRGEYVVKLLRQRRS